LTWRLNRSRPPQQPELGSSPAPFIPRAADLPPMPDLLTGDVQGLPTVVTAMWPTTDVPEIHIRRSAICVPKIIKLPTGSRARDWGASSAPNPERPQLSSRELLNLQVSELPSSSGSGLRESGLVESAHHWLRACRRKLLRHHSSCHPDTTQHICNQSRARAAPSLSLSHLPFVLYRGSPSRSI
jgi:hypothetical protein